MSAADPDPDYIALARVWWRRCNGMETLQGAPISMLLLLLLCELPAGMTPCNGEIITDALRSIVVIVERMQDEIIRGGDITMNDLRALKLRLDITLELRRRERGSGKNRDPGHEWGDTP